MAAIEPKLFADDRGVWCRTGSGRVYGIEWNEICSMSGYKLDCITEVDTIVVLDFVYGHFLELNHRWDSFEQVVEAITLKLPRISPHWFESLTNMRVGEAPIVFWKRD